MRLILTVAVTCWPTTEVLFSGAGKRAKYCDQRDRMSVCLSVCLLSYLKNHTIKRACCLRSQLDAPLATIKLCYVLPVS